MRPTIKMIAELAGVTHATVSMVLNKKKGPSKEVAERIQKIADEIGYIPNVSARNLVRRKSDTIGIFLLNFPEKREDRIFYFYMEFLQEVMIEARKKGYSILFFTDEDRTRTKISYATYCLEHNIRSAIFFGMGKDDPNLEEVKNLKSTQVILFDIEETSNSNTIISDSSTGIQEMIEHLEKYNMRSLAVISGTTNAEIATVKKNKELKKLAKKHSIKLEYFQGDFYKKSGYEIGKKIDVNKYDCIFAMNDAMGIGVLEGLKERGITVPNDISIIGFDNLLVTDVVSPKLSSIAHDSKKVIKSIFSIVKDDTKVHQLYVPTKFIKKESSK